jgi:thiol-disulfide isomerase/thioredoxin
MMKKLFTGLVLMCLLAHPIFSQQSRQQHPLMVFRGSPEEFDAELSKSRAANEDPLMLDVALLLYGIRDSTGDYLQSKQDIIRQIGAKYPKEQLDIHFLAAIAEAKNALNQGNLDQAEDLLKEAWWQFPQGGMMAGQIVEDVKAKQYFKELKVDMTQSIQLANGQTTSLKDLIGDNKGIVLDIWAEWCPYCMASMPELNQQAAAVRKEGLVLVGLNVDTEDGREKALKVQQEYKIDVPWLIDNQKQQYLRLFRAYSLPRWVLLDKEGKVLQSAHPQDPRWSQWLKAL